MAPAVGSVAAHAQSADLRYAMHAGEDVCVLRLEGTLAAPTAHEGERLVALISASPQPSLIVDASLLSEVDEVGVRLLLDLQRAVQSHDGRMIVYAATGSVARALDDSQLRP